MGASKSHSLAGLLKSEVLTAGHRDGGENMSRLKRIAVIENRRGGGGDPKRLMRRDVDIAQLSFLFLLSLKKGEVNTSEGFASFLTSFSLSQSKCTIPKTGHAAILLLIVGPRKCVMPDGPGSLDEHRTSAFRKRSLVPLPLPRRLLRALLTGPVEPRWATRCLSASLAVPPVRTHRCFTRP